MNGDEHQVERWESRAEANAQRDTDPLLEHTARKSDPRKLRCAYNPAQPPPEFCQVREKRCTRFPDR
jgi:hypothetical protein